MTIFGCVSLALLSCSPLPQKKLLALAVSTGEFEIVLLVYTVTPFKFAAIKVRGFEIMTYSRLFNFAVSYQNYFTVSYTNVAFSYTN